MVVFIEQTLYTATNKTINTPLVMPNCVRLSAHAGQTCGSASSCIYLFIHLLIYFFISVF